MTPDAAFVIVFVCRANQCRSAMAELAVRRWLDARPHVRDIAVASAGTEAFDGIPMAGVCAAQVHSLGVDARRFHDFRSRRLTVPIIDGAGVILTMERVHRHAVRTLHPAARDRTFTVREFARLTATADSADLVPVDGPPAAAAERARSLVGLAARRRGEEASAAGAAVTPESDDIFDPIGGRVEDVQVCFRSIIAALDRPLRLIMGGSAP